MPAPKQYYSDRPAMLRIAAAAAVESMATPTPLPPARTSSTSFCKIIADSSISVPFFYSQHEQDDDDDDEQDDEQDLFYTPRSSIASDTDMSLTITTPPTSDADHAHYTDKDWANEIQWLATKIQQPKRKPLPLPQPRRSPAPSIMMGMTTLLEEDEDGPPVPPKSAPASSVIVSSRPSSSAHRPPPRLPPPRNMPTSPALASPRQQWPPWKSSADLPAPSHNQPPRLGFTHYRSPPSVPKAGVLVQVWAVGLDVVDLRLLGSFGRFVGRTISRRTASDVGSISDKSDKDSPSHAAPQVGFIPGRSFVGRVLECGWEVRDEVVRRGEWVVGLLDIRKSGALAEFITVDRHRIHRVPHPQIPNAVPSSASSSPSPTPPSSASSDVFPLSHQNQDSPYPSRPSSVSFTHDAPPSSRPSSRTSSRPHRRMRPAPPPARPPPPSLSLIDLALLPLGLAAYRAVRTLSNVATPTTSPSPSTWARDAVTPDGELADPFNPAPSVHVNARGAAGRRALVLQGHAGTGGLVARMLTRRGWRVCVHAPGSLGDSGGASADPSAADKEYMRRVQARARAWGVEEVVFDDGGAVGEGGDGGRGAAVRAIERLIGDGDAFDAVVDTVGGKEVWEAGERLLAENGSGNGGAENLKAGRRKQFTTTVGDCPARPIPSAKDNFRAGLRALRGNQNEGKKSKSKKENKKAEKAGGGRSEVGYAWVSPAQDVDWEGEDVRDSLGAVIRLALEEDGVRPVLEEEQVPLPFERAAEVFEARDGGVMRGGNVVVRVAS
ncbi:hypothetical protein C8R46DRAFT_1325263 [Mycena filopes]|nr:hypothetical protein C8R46DRAFT_1325263 [Mycena filopes]